MKKYIVLFVFAAVSSLMSVAQVFSTQAGNVVFFSTTPMEDIRGECKTVLAVMNVSTKELAFMITNTSFQFQNKLMEEHFNEKYMESDKFPKSSFKGKVNENVDLTKDGEYKVTVTGKLNIHGVEQERTISGTILVKDGKVQLVSNFKVKNVDHKIEIPTIVTAKIAEEIDVNVDVTLLPKAK
jgi:polyisoprenoid-binding protein YceI